MTRILEEKAMLSLLFNSNKFFWNLSSDFTLGCMRSFVYWYEYNDFTLTLIFLKTPVYELSSQEFAVVSIYQLKLR